MDNKLMTPAIVGIIAVGVGFVGGMQYQRMNAMKNFAQNARGAMQDVRNNRNERGNGQGMMQNQVNGGGMRGNGAVTGEVTAKDGKTLTIKMTDGSSRIVNLSDTTTYRLSTEASLDKIEVGTKVATFGTPNSDGSTTASSIEINPMLRGQNDLK